MPLVKVVPHMVLHQKMHVPVSVNFLESEMAFQHPVSKNEEKKKISQFALT